MAKRKRLNDSAKANKERRRQGLSKPLNVYDQKKNYKDPEVTNEDIEFFKEHGDYVEFLDTKEDHLQKTKEEKVEEEKPKKKKQKQETAEITESQLEDEEKELRELAQQVELEGSGSDKLELRLFQHRQKKLLKKKEQIATLCSQILESPEKHLETKFRELHKLSSDPDATIKKLAIVSECAIFKDVIPGYRIRQKTDSEMNQSATKETKSLWQFESTILNCYKSLLQTLEENIKDYAFNASSALRAVAIISVRCLCELLNTHPHFNYRTNIITTLAPLMNSKINEISELCCKCFSKLFVEDTIGEATLESVKLISQMLKSKGYATRTEVLDTFLNLRFTEDIYEIDIYQPNKKKKDSKKAKKSKHEKQLESDLKDAESEQTKEERKQLQTEIIKAAFLTYFRILKKASHSILMTSVLRGISRFSHYINVEVVIDMLESLREFINRVNLSVESKLECIVAAFSSLKHHDSLIVDLKDYYLQFYDTLSFVSVDNYHALVPLILQSAQLLLLDKKQIAMERVAAFVKRFATLSLHLPSNASIALLAISATIIQKYPRVKQLIDNESTSLGFYQPEVPDPEHCNAFSSKLFELAMLRFHYHPSLSKFASDFAASGTSELAKPLTIVSAPQLFENYDASGGLYKPTISKGNHPLKLKMSKDPKKRFYISPQSQTDFFVDATEAISKDVKSVTFAPYFKEMSAYQRKKALQRELTKLKTQRSIYRQKFKR